MSVIVSFATPKGIGSIHAPGIGAVRAMEVLAADTPSTEVAEEGEVAVITNAEADPIVVAFGPDPDGDAAASDADTSAGVGIAAGQTVTLVVAKGDAVAYAAVPEGGGEE